MSYMDVMNYLILIYFNNSSTSDYCEQVVLHIEWTSSVCKKSVQLAAVYKLVNRECANVYKLYTLSMSNLDTVLGN